MNIFEKLSAIGVKVATLEKDLVILTGKSSYKAVGEANVLKAIKPLEEEYKVFSYPASRKIIDSGVIETIDYQGKTKKQFYERIETTYRFVNIENPDEFIDIVSYGDGIDSGDKSVGKAMTYCDKYALLKMYKMVTGDDPDKDASPELVSANVLSADVLEEAKKYDVNIENYAKYIGKKVGELTNDDLKNAIEKKKERRGE